ncbi:hypothetical protein F4803DRAFT_548748 [Xylaria telfairii]|nr:hypothetical protein F4803DRAFT_548748 [Xylaria telfairii]
MSQPTDFDPGQAIQALVARVFADQKQHDLANAISELFRRNMRKCLKLESHGHFRSHRAVVYDLCTTLWAQIFGDYPPWWHIKFIGSEVVYADGDLSTAMESGVLVLLHAFASHYPTEALQLLEHTDFRKILTIGDLTKMIIIMHDHTSPPRPDGDQGIHYDMKGLLLLWDFVVVVLLAVFVPTAFVFAAFVFTAFVFAVFVQITRGYSQFNKSIM